MEVKGHALFWGAVSSSVLLGSADTIGGERKKKKASDTIPSLLSPSVQGAALTFPGGAKCSGQH